MSDRWSHEPVRAEVYRFLCWKGGFGVKLLSAEQVAEYMHLTRGTVQRQLDLFVKDGFVEEVEGDAPPINGYRVRAGTINQALHELNVSLSHGWA